MQRALHRRPLMKKNNVIKKVFIVAGFIVGFWGLVAALFLGGTHYPVITLAIILVVVTITIVGTILSYFRN